MSWRKIVEILAGGLAGYLLGKYASLALYTTVVGPIKLGNTGLFPILISTVLGLIFVLFLYSSAMAYCCRSYRR